MASSEATTRVQELSVDGEQAFSGPDAKTKLSFHQKQGKFASGVMPSDPDRLDRLRKDALEDFNRATVERARSVHQMAAMFARSSSVETLGRTSGGDKEGGKGVGGRSRQSSGVRDQGSMGSQAESSVHGDDPLGTDSGAESFSSRIRLSRPISCSSAASSVCTLRESEGGSGSISVHAANAGSIDCPSPSPTRQGSGSKFTSFSTPSTTDLRALDLKQMHLNEARALASNRSSNVKDIASAFRGESRPENVEVFHKRHAAQEKAYRFKVHEGKETLKKTSQGTDAMYDFVLKLNLATTEGKERFLRRWAVGRIANGESPSPKEGLKFLQSLGINKPKKPPAKLSVGSATAPASAVETMPPPTGLIKDKKRESLACTPARGRGMGRGRSVFGSSFGSSFGGSIGSSVGSPRASVSSLEPASNSENESSAWEAALSRAVGGLMKVDADACAPKIEEQRKQRRRRSGSEPRRPTPQKRQAAETCRPMRSKAFWGAEPAEANTSGGRKERSSLSLSPSSTPPPRLGTAKKARNDSFRALSPERGSLDRRMSDSSDDDRSDAGSLLGTPTRRIRLSLSRAAKSSSRFSISPSRRARIARPPSTSVGKKEEEEAVAALAKVVEWESPSNEMEPLGLLQLPDRITDGSSEDGAGAEGDVEDMVPTLKISRRRTVAHVVSSVKERLHTARPSALPTEDSMPDDDSAPHVTSGIGKGEADNGGGELKVGDETGGSEEDFGHSEDVSTHGQSFFGDLRKRLSGGGDVVGLKADVQELSVAAEETAGWTTRTAPKSPEEVQEMFQRAIRLSEVNVEGAGTLSDDDEDSIKLPGAGAKVVGSLSDDEDDAATIEYNDEDTLTRELDDLDDAGGSGTDHGEDREEGGAEPEDECPVVVIPTPTPCNDSLAVSSWDDQDVVESESKADAGEEALVPIPAESATAADSGNGDEAVLRADDAGATTCPLVWNVTFEVPEDPSQHGRLISESTHSVAAESYHSLKSTDLVCSEELSASEDMCDSDAEESERYSISDAAAETVSDVATSDDNVTVSDSSRHTQVESASGQEAGVECLERSSGSQATCTPDDVDGSAETKEIPADTSPVIDAVPRSPEKTSMPPVDTGDTSSLPPVVGDVEYKHAVEPDQRNVAPQIAVAPDASEAEVTTTTPAPGPLDQSDPAFWDGLTTLLKSPRTTPSFGVDAQMLGAVDIMSAAGSAGRSSISPTCMFPASPASSFSGDGSFFDGEISAEVHKQVHPEETTYSVYTVRMENEHETVVEPVAVTVVEEVQDKLVSGEDLPGVIDPRSQPETEESERDSVGGDGDDDDDARRSAANDDVHGEPLGQEESRPERDVLVGAVGCADKLEDDSKDITEGGEQGVATTSEGHVLDLAVGETLAPSADEQVEDVTIETAEEECSTATHTEHAGSTASCPSMSADSALAAAIIAASDGDHDADDMSSTAPGTESALSVLALSYPVTPKGVEIPKFPKSPLVAGIETPLTGEPMRTPVPSPTGSTDLPAVDFDAPVVGDPKLGGEDAAEIDLKVGREGGTGAGVSAPDLTLDGMAPDEPEEGLCEAGVGEGEEGDAGEENMVLEVQALNPYTDFDALHDRDHSINTPKLDCNLVGFCRPRMGSFYNPSTRSSGVDFFSGAVDDGSTLDGRSASFRPRSDTLHTNNPSTRGSGAMSFPWGAHGGDGARSNIFAEILGFCRPRGSAAASGSVVGIVNEERASERGTSFPVVMEEEQVDEEQDDAASVVAADAAGGARRSKREIQPSVLGDAPVIGVAEAEDSSQLPAVTKSSGATPVRHFVSETLGLGCSMS